MSIIVKNINYAYGSKKVIDNVELEAHSGEIVAIIGPNGAGKSSLLKLLSGELVPDEGEIYYDEENLNVWGRKEIACIRAVLRQEDVLSFAFTVLEVVLMGRSPHKTIRNTDREITLSALKAMDAIQFKDRLYTELSGGEKQRVQLARCLAQIWENNQPRYLLLDEPVSALDIAHQKILSDEIRKLSRNNATIVLSLHDLNLAAQLADRVILLAKGQVIANDKPEGVITSSLIESVYETPVSIVRHPETNIPQVILR